MSRQTAPKVDIVTLYRPSSGSLVLLLVDLDHKLASYLPQESKPSGFIPDQFILTPFAP